MGITKSSMLRAIAVALALFGMAMAKYDCESHTSCGACTADVNCGWCPATNGGDGACYSGTQEGPLGDNCTLWEYSICGSEPCKHNKNCKRVSRIRCVAGATVRMSALRV